MIVKLLTNPLSGDYSIFDIEAQTAGDITSFFNDPNIQVWQNNHRLGITDELDPTSIIIVKRAPEAVAASVIGGILAFAIIATAGTMVCLAVSQLFKALTRVPKIGDIQASPSLRGSSNQARKNQKYPILLGKHRVYPDLAALPYTEYDSSYNQYLIELFNFGYKDIDVDVSSVRIGDTPLSSYQNATFLQGLGVYTSRVVESSIQVELENNAIKRTTSSQTTKVSIGLSAPSGLYRLDDNGNKTPINVGIKIEWAPKNSNNWTTAYNTNFNVNANSWRKSYEFVPSGDENNQYDIKVTRTSSVADDIRSVDTIFFDVLRCILVNDTPSKIVDDSKLYCLKIQASKQLNGIIDSINADCTLICRAYSGSGTGPNAWIKKATANPASAILYLLTDKLANPRALDDDQINWYEFEEFYKFCEIKGFECNAWIASEQTISDLIDYIALSNLAQIRKTNAKIGIYIDNGEGAPVQLFTPHNASDFAEEINMKQLTNAIKIKFVDKEAGYAELERYVSLDRDSNVVFDEELDKNVDVTEINLFGVTSVTHASKVARTRLLELSRRNRIFRFKTDIEGLLCTVGDVILLNHDSFLIGAGEGRVVDRVYQNNNLVGIVIDNEIKISQNREYGCTIRTSEKVYENIPVVIDSLNPVYVEFKQPLNFTVSIDDIVAIGPINSEAIKVIITEIERSDDYECTITAVDLLPEIYQEGDIPLFNSGLTIPSESEKVGAGIIQPPIYNAPVVMPSTYSNFEFTITTDPNIPPVAKETYFKYGDYYISYSSHKIVSDDIWQSKQPSPKEGEYVWMRMLGKDGHYIIVRITGEVGAPATSWDCVFNPSTYENSPRRKQGFKLQILCTTSNISNPVFQYELTTPELSDAVRGYRLVDATVDEPTTIEILPGATPKFVEIKVTLINDNSYKIIRCYGTESAETQPIYLGAFTSLPDVNSFYKLIINEDWFFYYGEDSEENKLLKGHVYKYQIRDNTWVETTEMVKLQAVQDDASKLCDKNVFAKVIFAQKILVSDLLVNGSFAFEKEDKAGNRCIFKISEDEVISMYGPKGAELSTFKIDMDTGKVYLGESDLNGDLSSGFMYNPKNKSIESKDQNIIIDQQGRISAKNGEFSGTINAKAFKNGNTSSSYDLYEFLDIPFNEYKELYNSFYFPDEGDEGRRNEKLIRVTGYISDNLKWDRFKLFNFSIILSPEIFYMSGSNQIITVYKDSDTEIQLNYETGTYLIYYYFSIKSTYSTGSVNCLWMEEHFEFDKH